MITDLLRTLSTGVQNVGQGMKQQFGPPADPQAIDPTTGLPAGLVHQARMNSLSRMGMLFAAAGQPMTGADRAKLLAEAGTAGDPSRELYTMAQARLMNQQVSDSMAKRQRHESALSKLQQQIGSMEFMNDRERMIFESYLEAGDPEGALDFLSKQNSQVIPLPDGTTTTKGVLQADTTTWNKGFLPTLQNMDTKVSILSDALDIMEQGFVGGQLANPQMVAEKLSKYMDGEVDPAVLNTEMVRSLMMNIVVERMKDLGGNDSYQELQVLSNLLVGDKLEPETIANNIRSWSRRMLQDGVAAAEQKKRVGRPDFGLPVEFSPDMLPPQYRPLWDKVAGKKAGAPVAAPPKATGSGTPQSFKHLWEN